MGKLIKENWLGILPDGTHTLELTEDEQACLKALKAHVGRERACPATELALSLFGCYCDPEQAKRETRRLINHLIINHDIPIICMSGLGGGYYMPGDASEVEQFYEAFHKRAMTGLVKASRGKKAAFVDIVEQLTFAFDDEAGTQAFERLRLTPETNTTPAWVSLVTRYLDKIRFDPDKYAAEIRAIQKRYGDVFVSRERLTAIRDAMQALQEQLKEVA